ncbi:alpha/beta hydrolase [Actinomycetospora sp. NBRC 106375]|uniref:alpha/beta fold hydrolase n=1 Tax=Actinomycetospora sp. NBRC 106375 TaxID=3032207 RepID=UPI0024A43926|nr:alpha/beta hydrolase [Actinomycetospora sp. NBRC 106375]GLZ47625.1 alpha/beta hydrolase [Actinomycetospora sp. NBRC 106375]
MTATRQTRTLHGARMSYVEACPDTTAGDGDPEVVVLVHGIAGSAETWDPVLRSYERTGCDRLLLAPELLGHGESAGMGGDFSLGAYANGLRDLLSVLGHRRVTVVGHSLGGGVAMQFAYQFPEMCTRLVLVSSGGLGRGVSPLLRAASLPGAEWVLPALASAGLLGLGAGALRLAAALPSFGDEAVSLRETARHAASLTERAHLDAFVDTVRAVIGPRGQRVSGTERLYLTEGLPTMIVWGERDPVIPVGHAHRAATLVPHARLELFGGAGHFPHCDEPERFAALLTDFCDTSAPAELDVGSIGPRVASRG